MPDLTLPDLNDQRQAGNVTRFTGNAFTRAVLPEDFQSRTLTDPPPQAGTPGWAPVAANATFFLGTLFHLRPGATVQINTAGTWMIALDGEGEFIFEDARTREDKSVHTINWIMKKGQFRAKPFTYDKTEHWLQIRTPNSRVLLQQGELGLRVDGLVNAPPDKPKGQVWLVSGKATVYWNDGKQKELPLRQFEYL
jgi:hypothetical protein